MFVSVSEVLFIVLAFSFSAMAQERINGKFAGWADIDSSGRLTSFSPDAAANAALTKALRHELQQRAFVPARRDSSAVAIRTHVRGDYALEEKGDEYVLHVARAEVGPKVLLSDLPRSPQRVITMNESGWARAAFKVGADGKARDVVIEHSAGASEIRRNVRESILRWRFEPETVDGAPVETLLRKDFIFARVGTSIEREACPVENSGRVLAPGQAACETMEARIRSTLEGPSIRVP